MVLKKPIRDGVKNYKNLEVKDLVIIGLRSKAKPGILAAEDV